MLIEGLFCARTCAKCLICLTNYHRGIHGNLRKVGCIIASHFEDVGEQGRLPQNMSQWYIDYFELKLLKKWPMHERYSNTLPCLSESRKWISYERCTPYIWRQDILFTRIGNWGLRNLCKQILLLLSFTTPSPNSI